MIAGHRGKDLYLGPDGVEVRRRLETLGDLKLIRKQRIDMTRSLRSARMPAPDAMSGNLLSVLSEAGAFRLRAVVVGTVAFRCYGPMLGVRFENTMGQTGDLDLAQFHSIPISVDDRILEGFLERLQAVDSRFVAVPSPMDTRRASRYALRVGSQKQFSVDLLCPLSGPDRGGVTELAALGADAQLLRYLDFLIYGEVNAVALHGIGVPINVPAPERYAVYKLIVSRMRISTQQAQAKQRKDMAQAAALIGVLIEDRPDELLDVWEEARDWAPTWAEKLAAATSALPENLRTAMTARGMTT